MLTDTKIKKAKASAKPVKLFDGQGLHLYIGTNGSKLWRLAYRHLGKQKLLSFGPYPEVTLTDARERAGEARKLLAKDIDPGAAKKEAKSRAIADMENSFRHVANRWHAEKSTEWVKRTADKQRMFLDDYILPAIGTKPVSAVKAADLRTLLDKVRSKGKGHTASRLRETISCVFRWAQLDELVASNPADSLKGRYAAPKAVHRPAITERKEFAAFLADLTIAEERWHPVTRAAVRFQMLSFTRPSEMRLALWDEFDLDGAVWRVPAARMKVGKELQSHIVPLSRQAVVLLRDLHELTGRTGRVFTGTGKSRVMSENTVNVALHRMGYKDKQCGHGFRASARSMLAEMGWNLEALERQLDHAERNSVIAAYARSQYLEERQRMMQAWADFLDGLPTDAKVIPIGSRAA